MPLTFNGNEPHQFNDIRDHFQGTDPKHGGKHLRVNGEGVMYLHTGTRSGVGARALEQRREKHERAFERVRESIDRQLKLRVNDQRVVLGTGEDVLRNVLGQRRFDERRISVEDLGAIAREVDRLESSHYESRVDALVDSFAGHLEGTGVDVGDLRRQLKQPDSGVGLSLLESLFKSEQDWRNQPPVDPETLKDDLKRMGAWHALAKHGLIHEGKSRGEGVRFQLLTGDEREGFGYPSLTALNQRPRELVGRHGAIHAKSDFFIYESHDKPNLRDTHDEVRISVAPDEVEAAWELILPILLENPDVVKHFKVTNMGAIRSEIEHHERAILHDVDLLRNPALSQEERNTLEHSIDVSRDHLAQARRVHDGAQITIRSFQPKEGDGIPPERFRQIVDRVTDALRQRGFTEGQRPGSDLPVNDYASFRNDVDGIREDSPDDARHLEDLKDSPLYVALTHDPDVSGVVDTLRELSQRVGEDGELRGRRDPEGGVRLYGSGRKPGLLSQITGGTIRRRERAREEMGRLLDALEGRLGQGARPAAREILEGLRASLGEGPLTGARLSQAVTDLARALHQDARTEAFARLDARDAEHARVQALREMHVNRARGFEGVLRDEDGLPISDERTLLFTPVRDTLNDEIRHFDRNTLRHVEGRQGETELPLDGGSTRDEIVRTFPGAPLPRQEIRDGIEPGYDTVRTRLREDGYIALLRQAMDDYLGAQPRDEETLNQAALRDLEGILEHNDWDWERGIGLPDDLRQALRNRAQRGLSHKDVERLLEIRQGYLRRQEGLELSGRLGPGLEALGSMIAQDLRALDAVSRLQLVLGDGRDIIDRMVDGGLDRWLPEDAPEHLRDRLVLRGLIAQAYEDARMRLAGEVVAELGLTEVEDFRLIASQLRAALRAGDEMRGETLVRQLGDLFVRRLGRLDDEGRLRLTLGDDRIVIEGLVQAMIDDDDLDPAGRESLRALAGEAYGQALAGLSNRVLSDTRVVLDGKTYTLEKNIGQGGFGRVDLYKAEDGARIVLKTPIVSDDSRSLESFLLEARNEVRSHRVAQVPAPDVDGVHPRVIGLRGAFRGPDGLVRIALEHAPGGNLYNLNQTLQTAIDQGVVSPEAATLVRILLFRDMLEGMRHVQEARGMMHLDFKSPNVFIGEDGSAKVGDFGTSRQGDTLHLDRRLVTNPLWQPPELIVSARENQRVLREGGHGGFETSGKTDIWSLGITAYEIFSGGKLLFDDPKGFMSKVEDKLLAFGGDETHRVRALGTDQEGNPVGMGATALDRLLNQLLHPDPEQRPGLGDILEGNLFDELMQPSPDGNGLIEAPILVDGVRDLVKAISTGDMDRARELSEALGR